MVFCLYVATITKKILEFSHATNNTNCLLKTVFTYMWRWALNNILENLQRSNTTNKNYTDLISFVGTDDRTRVSEKTQAKLYLHFTLKEVLHVISYGKYTNQDLNSGHAHRPGYPRAAVKFLIFTHFRRKTQFDIHQK